MSFLIVMVLLLVVMYVVMIRPQRQRQMTQQRMIEAAGVGDDILTTGGIYGTVTEVDGDDIVVEIADGIEVHMTRRGVAAVLPPEDDEHEDDEATDDGSEARETAGDQALPALEAPVTDGEEGVTSRDAAGAAGETRS